MDTLTQLDRDAIAALQSDGVRVTLKPWYIWIVFQSEAQSKAYQQTYKDVLSVWGQKFRILTQIQGDLRIRVRPKKGIKMSGKKIILDPAAGLQLGRMKLDRVILDIFTYYLENPTVAGGLVRLADNHQCALSLKCAEFMPNDSSSLADAVEWKRPDYWRAEDLLSFQASSELWTPNDGEWHEHTYFTFDPLKGPETETGWTHYTNRFKLIVDAYGNQYHVGENLSAEPCDRPS